MRYIDLDAVLKTIPTAVLNNLLAVDTSLSALSDDDIEKAAAKGNLHWKHVKIFLEAANHRKCWYTDSRNTGFVYDVEHFRPKGKVVDKTNNLLHWYWFLAFKPSNYRLSSYLPNRLNINPLLGATGGKGDRFPLLRHCKHATNISELAGEIPVLLDPCNPQDVALLAFLPDGRPVIAPQFKNDVVAAHRVAESNLLLNLDYPTFNVERERLYNRVKELVHRGDKYALGSNDALQDVQDDLRQLMDESAEYSMAARCYVFNFRDRQWIEDLL